jgi:hypothetical protein
MYRDAGFKVGVTIRPQRVTLVWDRPGHLQMAWDNDEDWWGKKEPPADIQDFWFHQMEMKIRFARQRWGATIFYIDSNGAAGGVLPALIFRRLAEEFPDVLLIPEHSTFAYWNCCAPYRDLTRLSADNITPPAVRRVYPGPDGHSPCFSVICPTFASMRRCWPQLVQEIRQGDILLYQGWFDCAEIPAVKAAYAAAAKKR